LDWAPPIPSSWSAVSVLGHLLDCLAGVCAVLLAAEPERLWHFDELRGMPVNHRAGVSETIDRLSVYRLRIAEGFEVLQDSALSRIIPTVFTESGETVLTLLLGNLEHLINHKHQLFMYLRLMGVEVGTPDLYRFRG
jgi:DinB superfamily